MAYSCPTRSRLGFRVSAPGCHLAGQTSSPCSWTNWQGLDLPQQLVGVAAHVAGVDLIGHDLPLGVHHKGAPLGHAVGLDIDLEVLGQGVGGVGQHGVLNLLDALGGVMPGLVDEMGVAGDGVDLAAGGLEVGVLVGQVLQLRGADEGKVGGVEEEHRPLAQDIGLGDRLECPLVVGLDA